MVDAERTVRLPLRKLLEDRWGLTRTECPALAAEVAATIKASMNAWLNGDGNIGYGIGGHPGLHRIQVTWT